MEVQKLNKNNLKFIEKLGEGDFGEIHLCLFSNQCSSLAAVKYLRKTTSHTLKYIYYINNVTF